jgi:hypothetical protein
MSGIRRQRQSSQGWRALLTRFASSGQTVRAFCESEAISSASFYRWRSLLGAAAARVPVASALPLAPIEFVDLGPLLPPSPSPSPSFELHLDLGGGLTLHLVRR